MKSFCIFQQDHPHFNIKRRHKGVKLNSSVWLNEFSRGIIYNPNGKLTRQA